MGKDFIIVLLSVLQVIEQIFAATVGDEMQYSVLLKLHKLYPLN